MCLLCILVVLLGIRMVMRCIIMVVRPYIVIIMVGNRKIMGNIHSQIGLRTNFKLRFDDVQLG